MLSLNPYRQIQAGRDLSHVALWLRQSGALGPPRDDAGPVAAVVPADGGVRFGR